MKKLSKFITLCTVSLLALTGSVFLRPAQALDKTVTQSVMHAVVQLGPIADVTNKKGKTEVRFFGWGSGTLLTAEGYILTNHHVTDVSDLIDQVKSTPGVKIREGQLVVLLTRRSDQPAVATYIAEVVADSADLDLAILKITKDLSGKAVDSASLNLPFVELGDSDSIDLGDTINIFGYPGIGGDTITFTSGNVSGFDSDTNIEGRAWIKTDATIAGGNSGGTGVDNDGKLIGVPTRIFSNKEGQSVDCRRLADTNGDGKIDESDTCIPVGGFINALRPVNLAKDLIQGAIGQNTTEPTTTITDGVKFTGKIVDADTGKPIASAVFVVLNQGVNWDAYDNSDDQILDAVQTDRNGLFEMTELVERGQNYSVGWGAKGYQ
ncbi:MAG TPA: serine protease, partial [Anaerolineae bacterium]